MQTKQEILRDHLIKYFEDDGAMRTLSNVLLDGHLSLRLIDYFVCTYSKIFNVSYKVDTSVFNVFIAYKSILKGYNKKYFDCFCRGKDRMEITSHTHGKTIVTTVGQLHFFAWASKHKVIDYVKEHMHEIEQHMVDSFQRKKVHTKTSTRKKYTVQASNQKGITATRVQLLLNFE